MKKILSILAVAFLALTITSCGDKDKTPKDVKGTTWGMAAVTPGTAKGATLYLKSDYTVELALEMGGSAVTKAANSWKEIYAGTYTYKKPNLVMELTPANDQSYNTKADKDGSNNNRAETVTGTIKGNRLSFQFHGQTFTLER